VNSVGDVVVLTAGLNSDSNPTPIAQNKKTCSPDGGYDMRPSMQIQKLILWDLIWPFEFLRFCEIKILAKSTWKLQPVHMPSDLVMTLTHLWPTLHSAWSESTRVTPWSPVRGPNCRRCTVHSYWGDGMIPTMHDNYNIYRLWYYTCSMPFCATFEVHDAIRSEIMIHFLSEQCSFLILTFNILTV